MSNDENRHLLSAYHVPGTFFPRVLQVVTHLILPRTLEGNYFYHPHFGEHQENYFHGKVGQNPNWMGLRTNER